MSQDIQLAHNNPPADFWTHGGSAVLAPPTPPAAGTAPFPPRQSPLTKAHRLLRGRYPLAITLAAAGAVTGGLLGYFSMPPKYASVATVLFNPRIYNATTNSRMIDDFPTLVANHMGYIASASVAEASMADKAYVDAYHLAYPGQPLPDDETFSSGIAIDHPHNTTLLNVSYVDRSKAVAETASAAVLKAYTTQYGTDDNFQNTESRIAFNRSKLEKVEADLAAHHRDLDDMVRQAGGINELAAHEANVEDRRFKDEADLKAYTIAYAEAVALTKGGPRQPKDDELAYQQIRATGDHDMEVYLDARTAALVRLQEVAAEGHLPNSPVYQQAYRAYAETSHQVDDYAHQFLFVHPGAIASTLTDSNGRTSVDAMRVRMAQLQASVDADRVEASDLAAQRQKVQDIQAEIAHLEGDRASYRGHIEEFMAAKELTKTVVATAPGEATITNDKRKMVGAAGVVLGGLLPLGLMMLYGMRDSRFRYSDQTTEADLAGVALLGILPNLPDRLSDPQQAGVAAHCVHQIRTMLQISRSNDEPQVLAVTSASTGDGKTSLTLALGLSYAACGARTLLVDCDLVAAGLTHRLNVSSPDGVLEAVANRALLEYVRTTDIADVAILPVGTTHAHHASTLSPVALRRLLSEAKKQFDIIIVDTGPILASIEASLICAAADRTILAVARNQQRPLVERSIGHLQAIGASLAGVVFNRAQARDFEKSMSGLSLRSRPAPGNPAASTQGGNGSVAKAVAGSFKRAG